jgi:hypothetical protein
MLIGSPVYIKTHSARNRNFEGSHRNKFEITFTRMSTFVKVAAAVCKSILPVLHVQKRTQLEVMDVNDPQLTAEEAEGFVSQGLCWDDSCCGCFGVVRGCLEGEKM